MSLYVVPVPNPAAGHDWKVTVPGQYLWDIVGITATLTPAITLPTTAADSSGNGRNATYNSPNLTWGVAGPFGGSPNLAVDINPPSTVKQAVATFANAGVLDLATFTYEALVKPRDTGIGSFECIMGMQQASAPFKVRDYLALHRTSPNSAVGYFYVGNSSNFPGGNITDGAWHQIALTYDGTTWTLYSDGVSGGNSTTGSPDATVTLQPFDIGGNTASASNIYNGAMAAASVYSGVLSAARIAAHNTAIATSAASYKTAVLADSPLALWMLDEQTFTNTRTVALDITNGTTLVEEIPAGNPVITSTGPMQFSWGTQLNSSSQTAGGVTNSVAIPPLVLPAGYTIGTHTLDLAAGDQWSNIFVWWDDALQQSMTPYSPYAYPPGALLTYRQQGT